MHIFPPKKLMIFKYNWHVLLANSFFEMNEITTFSPIEKPQSITIQLLSMENGNSSPPIYDAFMQSHVCYKTIKVLTQTI